MSPKASSSTANGCPLVGAKTRSRGRFTLFCLNGLEEKDVYIILTCIAPEKFAELNVTGQRLGNEEIIDEFHQDQIHQAVGRNRGFPGVQDNRGFRESTTRQTKTAVIASPRLWNSVLSKLQEKVPRVQLYLTNERPW
jgi:hypothetical protein